MRKAVLAALLLIAASTLAAADCEVVNYCDANSWPVLCLRGAEQSPIDISSSVPTRGAAMDVTLGTFKPRILNTKHSIKVINPVGQIRVDGTLYQLIEFHFHAPSEHTFGGTARFMEMHLVFGTGSTPKVAVAVLFDRDTARNQQLDAIVSRLPIGPCEEKEGAELNLNELVPADRSYYYRYNGSLTTPTPDCTQGLIWLVLNARATANDDQRLAIKGDIGWNARQARHPGNRAVRYYYPGKKKKS